jgi:hypothetical protein
MEGLDATPLGDRLRISSSKGGSDVSPHLEVRGPARRLYDVELTMRFRVRGATGYDLAFGVERADAPSSSAAEKVAFGLFNAREGASYRFFGDERPDTPFAGDGLARQRKVPFDGAEEEHEIALVLRPDLHLVLGLVDGSPVSSHLVGWDDGVLVRPVLFVRGRAGGEPVEAEVLRADFVPLPRSSRPQPIAERFEGAILDPAVWSVIHADGWKADGSVATTSPGLDLRGRALRRTQEVPVLGLVGPIAALGSFHAVVRFSVRTLRHARLYFGISNLLAGLTDWRLFEAGLVDGPTQLDPYIAGHWEGDGQLDVEPLPGATGGAPAREIALDYDAESGLGFISFDGRLVAERRLDFEPPERARFELGARVLDGEGAFDVHIEEVRFSPRAAAAGRVAAPLAPRNPALGSFVDVFATDSRAAYHVLFGTASWGSSRLQLGPDTPVDDGDHVVVRGFFDRPVSVSGSVLLADDPVRGAYDSVGVLATDHDGAIRYAAVLWYGSRLPAEFHLTRQGAKGIEFLSSRPAVLDRNKSYWVKLHLDRTKAYARYWPDEPGASEPEDWALEAPLTEGWTATGGVGLTAHATKTWANAIRAE